MKKFSLVMILVGCILVGCSDKPNDIKEQQPEVETEQQVAEEETPEEEQDKEDEENNTEEKPQETNDSDELSPDETENHYDELEADKRFNDIQVLAKALAEASGRSYDDTWNDIYHTAITYGFEYAQNYANSEIKVAKAKRQAGVGQGVASTSKEELLNNIDDCDYACLALEYIPSGNIGGASFAAEASKYPTYMDYYFSVPQETRTQLKYLFKGECSRITGEDWYQFQSEINGYGQQLREAIRSGLEK